MRVLVGRESCGISEIKDLVCDVIPPATCLAVSLSSVVHAYCDFLGCPYVGQEGVSASGAIHMQSLVVGFCSACDSLSIGSVNVRTRGSCRVKDLACTTDLGVT